MSREQQGRAIPQAVCIVMYHAIVRTPLPVADWCFLDEEAFRRQFKYLATHFEIIPLSTVVARVREGTIHRPTAAITFDDGFQDNYEVAFPILRREGLPATIFLTTGLIGTNDTLWFCRLNRAMTRTSSPALEWRGCRFDLSCSEAKARASSTIQAQLKAFPHARLFAELRALIRDLGDDPDAPMEADSPFRMLSRQAVLEMAGTDTIEMGAHTHSHAILSLLSRQEQQAEIAQSLDAVRDMTGRPCRLFAYPNGRREDYDPASIRILTTLGVQTCVTAIEGLNDGTTPALELRRYGVGGEAESDDFERLIHAAGVKPGDA